MSIAAVQASSKLIPGCLCQTSKVIHASFAAFHPTKIPCLRASDTSPLWSFPIQQKIGAAIAPLEKIGPGKDRCVFYLLCFCCNPVRFSFFFLFFCLRFLGTVVSVKMAVVMFRWILIRCGPVAVHRSKMFIYTYRKTLRHVLNMEMNLVSMMSGILWNLKSVKL